jgi:hypothetical protein
LELHHIGNCADTSLFNCRVLCAQCHRKLHAERRLGNRPRSYPGRGFSFSGHDADIVLRLLTQPVPIQLIHNVILYSRSGGSLIAQERRHCCLPRHGRDHYSPVAEPAGEGITRAPPLRRGPFRLPARAVPV